MKPVMNAIGVSNLRKFRAMPGLYYDPVLKKYLKAVPQRQNVGPAIEGIPELMPVSLGLTQVFATVPVQVDLLRQAARQLRAGADGGASVVADLLDLAAGVSRGK